jgi:hypothetical protein
MRESIVGEIAKPGKRVDRVLEDWPSDYRSDDREQFAVIVVHLKILVDQAQFRAA